MTHVKIVLSDPAKPEATFHVDKLLTVASDIGRDFPVDLRGGRRLRTSLLMDGERLADILANVRGTTYFFNEYSFRVTVGPAFGLKPVLYRILLGIEQALGRPVDVIVQDDSDVITAEPYRRDPSLQELGEQIDRVVDLLSARKQRESELTDEVVERVVRALQAQGVIATPRPPISRQM